MKQTNAAEYYKRWQIMGSLVEMRHGQSIISLKVIRYSLVRDSFLYLF